MIVKETGKILFRTKGEYILCLWNDYDYDFFWPISA